MAPEPHPGDAGDQAPPDLRIVPPSDPASDQGRDQPAADQHQPDQHTVGPAALKGLAHPLRLQLLAALNDRGSATASQLAAALGESSGATSYHLRQLHRHGFVEEDPDAGSGRERYWIPRRGGWDLPVLDLAQDAANAAAIDLVMHEQLVADQRRQLAALASAPGWPAEWRNAISRHEAVLSLDAGQTRRMIDELDAVIRRYLALPPGPGARRVAVLLNTLPTDHEVDR
ncbi:ArsR/SmtB family transcription factor [Nakamurella lactea]|uniref:ArsR/SmtB family transcription factor n=1 Tax=Nakamurella lactea TaxID=459515 RepID=UPI00040682A0|nr:winged helix-turn-helix domain-containing protein [Nakamurella lactea]